jgi:hypothetical protein
MRPVGRVPADRDGRLSLAKIDARVEASHQTNAAAVALLARYGGRTLESHRADLRQFLQWCADIDVAPLAATRTLIELYGAEMDQRGLAPSMVDRRLSTVCGYSRFAHIDGRITSTRRSTCADPASIRPRSTATWSAPAHGARARARAPDASSP